MENKEKQMAENIITPRKIFANLKYFWWFCIIPLVLCGLLVYRDTMSTYQANQFAAQKDMYITSALVYYPTEDEEIGKGNMVIFKSKNTIEKVNDIMVSKGYAPFDSNHDKLELGHTMASYGLTLIGEGEERMLCMGQAFAESMLAVIQESTGVSGYIVDHATVAPCMIDASGNTIIYDNVDQKQVTLSLRDFLTWKKMMILCAGVFFGLALIFVAILFDKKIRSREELEAFCQIPCMGVVGRKREKDKKLFLSLASAMCKEYGVTKLVFVSVTKENMLVDLADEVKGYVGDAIKVESCEGISNFAEAVNRCHQSDAVVLTIRKDVDNVEGVKRALSNLAMINSRVLGYIMTE